MFPTSLKKFVHPQSVYELQYPAHWDQVVEKNGESCGFGPHDRDDVGLWISIMPMSLDTDKLTEELPNMMQQALQKSDAANLRPDPTLRHKGMVADMTKDGQGGHYWIVVGGDVVLFASSQVPAAERNVWNQPFQQLMASLRITREDEHLLRKIIIEVMTQLKEKFPDEKFEVEGDKIRGERQMIYVGNLMREIRESPSRRDSLIKRFVTTLTQPTPDIGHETWDDARTCIVPVLKPRDYIKSEGPTQHMLTTEWLADVLICYAIKSKKMFRFVTGWDVNRWGTTAAALHEQAIANLAEMPWPEKMIGSSTKNSGRVIVVDTPDSLASSRLLHPELHRLFSGPLGSPFWAGIPDRNTLVLFSDRRELKQRIGRKLRKDCNASAYSITPRAFLVTRDGIAAPGGK